MGWLSALGVPRAGARGALNIITLACALTLPASRSITASPAQGALVVTVRSTAARLPPLRATTDVSVCGATLDNEAVVVANGLLANAIVRLPGRKAAHPAAVEVANEKCAFVPHVALAAPSASIRMVSRDHALHTVHARLDQKSLFNVGLPVPNITLTRPASGSGPVALKCNTHPWMSGFVYLTDEAAAVTGRDGVARFEGLPPGKIAIEVWHETLGRHAGSATIPASGQAAIEINVGGK